MATDEEILAIATPQISSDEGLETNSYLDSRGIATIGVGHTDRGIHLGMYWPVAQCLQQLAVDTQTVLQGLDQALPWWRTLNAARAAVLVNIGFNVGVHGLLNFHRMLAAAQAGEWNMAGSEITNSTLAPRRKARLAKQMADGVVVGTA